MIYVTATDSKKEIRKSLQYHGINTLEYENNGHGDGGLLLMSGEELYKNAENPDISKWKNSVKFVSDMFISKGKKGVRVAADLSSYFLSKGLIHQWHELEYILEKNFLCRYEFFVHTIQPVLGYWKLMS